MAAGIFVNCGKLSRRNEWGDIVWIVDFDDPEWSKKVYELEQKFRATPDKWNEDWPYIEKGYIMVGFYSYVGEIARFMEEAVSWLRDNPNFELEDVVIGEDEGIFLHLYGSWKEAK